MDNKEKPKKKRGGSPRKKHKNKKSLNRLYRTIWL